MPNVTEQDQAQPDAQPEGGRRGFLRAALGLAAGAVATATTAEAQTPTRRGAVPRRQRNAGPSPVRGVPADLAQLAPAPAFVADAWRDPVGRLVRRITWGITDTELERAKQLGYRGYLEEQLAPSRIDDRACLSFIQRTYPVVSMAPSALARFDAFQASVQLQEAALYRATFSRRQLQERMVDFWTDHFNIWRDDVGYLKVIDDRDVIRRHALGRFPDLLRASAHSAAMMEYLDQTRSRRGSPNENYAREIMELHTLGVDGGYTQQDVAELARVFTGWTRIGAGSFYYDANIHDFGVKRVLGRVIPSTAPGTGLAGKQEAERIIDFLAVHPNTARYISWKLARYFVAYTPSEALVSAAAAEFVRTQGDIPSVLRIILAEPTIVGSGPMYKRPLHLAVSSARALNPRVTSVATMRSNVDTMGQSLYAWPTPDGYPMSMEFWMGLVMQRWNTASAFATASATSTSFAVDPAPFTGTTVEETTSRIIARCLGGEVPESFRTRLADYIRPAPTSATRIREAMSLALSSAQFQWY
ncbi:MAG: DUF1800 domain-containing protein [Gemmatimonadaceae bacterium]|nr:DUF1800 domain-containing protein [Gemmatimonadaceae bacterium]